MNKRNDKLDEEVKKMRNLLKQAESEISRQDAILRVSTRLDFIGIIMNN